MGSSDLNHGPEWRTSWTLNSWVIPFVLAGLLTVQKIKKSLRGLLNQDLGQVLWKGQLKNHGHKSNLNYLYKLSLEMSGTIILGYCDASWGQGI